jgi:SOS-response transcriptional repressor LexA
MRANATCKQSEALRFIVDYRKRNNISPTLREIAAALGVNINAARHRIIGLEKRGLISRQERKSRTIVPVSK